MARTRLKRKLLKSLNEPNSRFRRLFGRSILKYSMMRRNQPGRCCPDQISILSTPREEKMLNNEIFKYAFVGAASALAFWIFSLFLRKVLLTVNPELRT